MTRKTRKPFVRFFTMLVMLLSMMGMSVFSVSAAPAAGQLFALQVACAVSAGVTQDGGTITGTSGNDTIDCTGATTD